MPALKERVNFTIDQGVRSRLESSVPRSKRSAFVEAAIEKALADNAEQELIGFLDALQRAKPKNGLGSVETVQMIRQQAQGNAVQGVSNSRDA